jgi:hypothetical protein
MIKKEALIAAYIQGESLIGGVSYSQDRIDRDELVTDNEIREVRNIEKPNTNEQNDDKDSVNKHLKKEK